jgi:hypothetical protein
MWDTETRGWSRVGLRLGSGLWFFWTVRGHIKEGRERLAELLELPGAQSKTTARARAQERGLNDGEAVNSASRAIFVGQRGEFRDRAYQDQVHRASCLHLTVGVDTHADVHVAAALDQLGRLLGGLCRHTTENRK